MSFVVIIPARYASTRLPGKPLADIHGQPMVQHVVEKALQSGADRVIVATDDERIAAHVRGDLVAEGLDRHLGEVGRGALQLLQGEHVGLGLLEAPVMLIHALGATFLVARVLHAVGLPYRERSHFDAQYQMEIAQPGRTSSAPGWLNQVAGLRGGAKGPAAALGVVERIRQGRF